MTGIARSGRLRSWNVWDGGANPLQLSVSDVCSGVVLGLGHATGRHEPVRDPRAELEDAARRLLEQPPCVVAFSGGRDSSVLLALLALVAHREGLPAPVALTARWQDDPSSDESSWQEEVIRWIGLEDWQVIYPHEDLDLLGVEATTALREHGLLWPAPSYALLPMYQSARGGTLVTGEGGDEAFALWPYAGAWAALAAHRRLRVRQAAWLASGFAPAVVRRALWARRERPYQTWLRSDLAKDYARRLATELAGDPVRFDRYLEVMRRRRSVRLGLDTALRLAGAVDCRYAAPFHEPSFLDALGHLGGRRGIGGRSAAMRTLFGDLLPESVLNRQTKATFGGVFWGPASREFARTWDGSGLDSDLIDVERLRRAWTDRQPVYGAALPLHAAWLSSHGT